ncbi:MAG: NAD(P)H-binding protein [Myxococcota bacterium]
MNVIVFGATGGLGQRVWKAAIAAGHRVVAFVRSPEKLDRSHPSFADLNVVTGNVLDGDAVKTASQGCTIAVNCTSPAGGDATLDLAKSAVTHAADADVSTFYMVGGIGALWVPGTDKTVLVQDWDDEAAMQRQGWPTGMPKEKIQAMTQGHLASMAFMASTKLAHAFICPGAMIDGEPSESRTVTLDELGGPAALRVRYADIAQVIVDDLEAGELLGHRVGVYAP